MSVFNLAPILEPQFLANGSAAALTFSAAAGGGSAVPANANLQIQVLRVANVSGSTVTLQIWRLPSGVNAVANQYLVVPSINIPVAANTFPWFDVTALWGAVLQTGDAIWALAGTANALTIQGDGAVITP